MDIKKKVKDYFTVTPDEHFWKHACKVLFFFYYVSIPVVLYSVFLQAGIASQGVPIEEMSPAFEHSAEIISQAYQSVFKSIFRAGQQLGSINPSVAIALSLSIQGFIYCIYASAFMLILKSIRYGTAWIYKKVIK